MLGMMALVEVLIDYLTVSNDVMTHQFVLPILCIYPKHHIFGSLITIFHQLFSNYTETAVCKEKGKNLPWGYHIIIERLPGKDNYHVQNNVIY
jgi:hypothetical protein